MKKQVQEEGLDGYDYYEGQPKWPLRRIVRVTFTVLAALVYLLLFLRWFQSCDADIGEKILLDAASSRIYPADGKVIRFDFATPESGSGEVQYSFATALPDAEVFQVTVKIKERAFPPEGEGAGYRFSLVKSGEEENTFFPTAMQSEERMGYRTFRLSFSGVRLSESDSLTLHTAPGSVSEDKMRTAPRQNSRFSWVVVSPDTYSTPIRPAEKDFLIVKNP